MRNEIQKADVSIYQSDETFVLAQRQAKAICASSVVPDLYRNNIPNTLIAMEIASRVGASVMAVMQNLCVIHGKPSFEAKFIITQVNNSPVFGRLQYVFSGEEGKDNWGCRAQAIETDSGELLVGPKVTISMAKAEGWYNKKGSKWQTMPELMLMYRAASFWQRPYASELTLGLLTSDEIHDSAPALAPAPRDLTALTEVLKQPTQAQLDNALEGAE